MTANALIDGCNLYYGLLKGTPYTWLDLWAFARALLKEDVELLSVKYFTALIKTHPHDQAAIDRQKIYLQALAAQGKVQVVHGFYGKHLKWSATYYKNIPRDLPAKCQLPDAIPVGTHGNFIRRPEAWK